MVSPVALVFFQAHLGQTLPHGGVLRVLDSLWSGCDLSDDGCCLHCLSQCSIHEIRCIPYHTISASSYLELRLVLDSINICKSFTRSE